MVTIACPQGEGLATIVAAASNTCVTLASARIGDSDDGGEDQALPVRASPFWFSSARVAKLVDAPGLGPDASNGVGVRVPPRAPFGALLARLALGSWPGQLALLG